MKKKTIKIDFTFSEHFHMFTKYIYYNFLKRIMIFFCLEVKYNRDNVVFFSSFLYNGRIFSIIANAFVFIFNNYDDFY